jgi:hypothetical protein
VHLATQFGAIRLSARQLSFTMASLNGCQRYQNGTEYLEVVVHACGRISVAELLSRQSLSQVDIALAAPSSASRVIENSRPTALHSYMLVLAVLLSYGRACRYGRLLAAHVSRQRATPQVCFWDGVVGERCAVRGILRRAGVREDVCSPPFIPEYILSS